MAPKPDAALKATISNDTFLAACIKYAKEKVVVDFDALAKDVGMSKGGAANKFRAIMKDLESQGASWATKDQATSPATPRTPKASANTKRKLSAPTEGMAAADSKVEDEDSAKEEPPKKKGRASAKSTSAARKVEKGASATPAKGRKRKADPSPAKIAAPGNFATGPTGDDIASDSVKEEDEQQPEDAASSQIESAKAEPGGEE